MLKRVTFILIGVFCSGLIQAQSRSNADSYLVEKITDQLSEAVTDIPVNIRRVSVYRLNYDINRFTKEDIGYVRAEIENTLKRFASLSIISPSELEPTNELKILGRDSTLQISNMAGRSFAESSEEYLLEIVQKYNIHALVELTIQKKPIEGYLVNIKMVRPQSQEIAWVGSFVSNPVVIKEKDSSVKLTLIRGGVSSFSTENTTIDSVLIPVSESVLSYSASVSYRQPIDKKKSGYVALNAGLNIFRSASDSSFNASFVQAGVSYYQAISQESENIDGYRIMFMTDVSVLFPLTNVKGEMFMVSPGLAFNLSENLGINAQAHLIVSGEELRLRNTTNRITYNKFGYGLQVVFRF